MFDFGWGVWPGEKKLHIYISRQKDICFTLVYGPFARKINSIFALRGWVKDPVLFQPHGMNLKQDVSSDCLKFFSSVSFHMENTSRTTRGLILSQRLLAVISGISENLKAVQHPVCVLSS